MFHPYWIIEYTISLCCVKVSGRISAHKNMIRRITLLHQLCDTVCLASGILRKDDVRVLKKPIQVPLLQNCRKVCAGYNGDIRLLMCACQSTFNTFKWFFILLRQSCDGLIH